MRHASLGCHGRSVSDAQRACHLYPTWRPLRTASLPHPALPIPSQVPCCCFSPHFYRLCVLCLMLIFVVPCASVCASLCASLCALCPCVVTCALLPYHSLWRMLCAPHPLFTSSPARPGGCGPSDGPHCVLGPISSIHSIYPIHYSVALCHLLATPGCYRQPGANFIPSR